MNSSSTTLPVLVMRRRSKGRPYIPSCMLYGHTLLFIMTHGAPKYIASLAFYHALYSIAIIQMICTTTIN